MQDDLDRRIGEIFRRLSVWRCELGPASLDRALADVMRALGAAAQREAEARAARLTARASAKSSIAVVPFVDRRPADDRLE
jgi:hypothetical protein